MALTLTIENETSLPDGGPLSVSVQGTRGIDIGRDQYLDWTLPDPSRSISGKHCEIRWHDGAYWLHDISTNGTFLHGDEGRLKAPHKLRNGDRFLIGHYVIAAAVDEQALGGDVASSAIQADTPDYNRLWDPVGESAPPIDPKQLKAPRDLQPVKPDFLQWAVDVASSNGPSTHTAPIPAPPVDDMSWAQSGPKSPPPPPPAVSPVPSPRRPVWVTGEPDGPWSTSGAPASTAPSPASPQPERTRASGAYEKATTNDFARLVARGAGLPDDAFAARNPEELATELGQLMRLLTENTKQLLEARQQAKRLVRSADHTTVQALDNNPLKFSPTIDDAMRIMFGPPTRSYLDARSAFSQAFGDLKTHQVKTFSAMQQALTRLLQELDPEVIEKAAPGNKGLLGMVGSRKAHLWDIYAAHWQARAHNQKEGMLNAFMAYFTECYDRDRNEV